jgi:hypothetical protein
VTAGAFVAGDAGRATDRAGGFLAAASPANKDRFVVEAVPRDFFPRKPPRVVLEPHVEPCAFEPVDDVVTVDSNVVALTEQLAPLVWSRDRRVFDGRTGVQPNGLQHVKVAQVGSDVPAWGPPEVVFQSPPQERNGAAPEVDEEDPFRRASTAKGVGACSMRGIPGTVRPSRTCG